jgi:hypothetical protein
LALDGAVTALFLVGAAVVTSTHPTLPPEGAPRPTAIEAAALGFYAVSPSVVHFARGKPWSGLSSIGLRVASPVLGFVVGSLLASVLHANSGDANQLQTVGATVGIAGAAVTDAAVLGWQRWTAPSAVALLRRDF